MLGGELAAGKTIVPVNYNNWLVWPDDADMIAAANLLDTAINRAVADTNGLVVVMSHSLGSIVTGRWQNLHGPTSIVNPARLFFVQLGNSVSLYGGQLTAWCPGNTPPASTRYPTIDFKREGDGWADYPALTTNANYWLAASNASVGQTTIHPNYDAVSLNDPNNQAFTPLINGVPGNITYMWSPTCPVPLYGTQNNALADGLDAKTRPLINAAQGRPVTMPLPNYTYDTSGNVNGVATPVFGY
jgi:diacyltrehalose acyltransferase